MMREMSLLHDCEPASVALDAEVLYLMVKVASIVCTDVSISFCTFAIFQQVTPVSLKHVKICAFCPSNQSDLKN